MNYFEVSREVARLASQYRYDLARRGIRVSVTDAIIAATAVRHAATLVTGDTSHYPIEGLSLVRLSK